MAMCGGLYGLRPADEEIQQIALHVKPEVEAKLGRSVNDYKAKEYKTQVVAGVNYFIKVEIGDGGFVHIRVFKDLQGNISLNSIVDHKTSTDELDYF